MEPIAALIEAITPVLWPVLVLFVILRFSPAVQDIIESAKRRKFTLKIGGQELTMEELSEQQGQLLASLQTQVEALREQTLPKEVQVERAAKASAPAPTTQRSVLWVDDNPKNNAFIVQMLRDKQITVDIALSTREAIQRLDKERYGLVVSDMGRDEEGRYQPDAGIILLKKVRERNLQIPFIIHSTRQKAREYGEQARQLGATTMTTSPTEVLGLILQDIGMSEE